jgi:hypothetical protein
MLKYIRQPVANQFKLDEMCDFLSTAEGDVVEIGVYQGGSLIHMASRFPEKNFYAYDTFEGMPDACDFDNYHVKGDFITSYSLVEKSASHLKNVTLIKGFYPDSDDINPNVVMAHLDVDIYTSATMFFGKIVKELRRLLWNSAFKKTWFQK